MRLRILLVSLTTQNINKASNRSLYIMAVTGALLYFHTLLFYLLILCWINFQSSPQSVPLPASWKSARSRNLVRILRPFDTKNATHDAICTYSARIAQTADNANNCWKSAWQVGRVACVLHVLRGKTSGYHNRFGSHRQQIKTR